MFAIHLRGGAQTMVEIGLVGIDATPRSSNGSTVGVPPGRYRNVTFAVSDLLSERSLSGAGG